MDNAAIVAERAGHSLAWLLSVSPARHVPEDDRPALLGDVKSRLAQFIRRREAPMIGLWVREKKLIDPRQAGEHAHGLLWLPSHSSAGSGITAEALALKKEIGALDRMARETMAAIE